jgi:hypothetical protein
MVELSWEISESLLDICEFSEAMRLFLLFMMGVMYASAPATPAMRMMQTVPSARATLRLTTFSGFVTLDSAPFSLKPGSSTTAVRVKDFYLRLRLNRLDQGKGDS